jgi:hypothetical protein
MNPVYYYLSYYVGIGFEYINQNTTEHIKEWGDCRKVTGDIGIDDIYGFVFWPWVAVKVWFMERGPGR